MPVPLSPRLARSIALLACLPAAALAQDAGSVEVPDAECVSIFEVPQAIPTATEPGIELSFDRFCALDTTGVTVLGPEAPDVPGYDVIVFAIDDGFWRVEYGFPSPGREAQVELPGPGLYSVIVVPVDEAGGFKGPVPAAPLLRVVLDGGEDPWPPAEEPGQDPEQPPADKDPVDAPDEAPAPEPPLDGGACEDAEQALFEALVRVEELSVDNEVLDAEIDTAYAAVDALDARATRLEARLLAAEANKDALQAEVSRLGDVVSTQAAAIDALTAQVQTLQDALLQELAGS